MPLQPLQITRKPLPTMAAQTRIHKFAIFPAPTKGLDSAAPLTQQDPLTAVTLDNWWLTKWGPELRGGYERWTTNLGGIGTEASVFTLMPYQPPLGSSGTAVPKLFAACGDGNIYDVTTQTSEATVPVATVNIPGQLTPGKFSFINFTNAGSSFLCICSAGGGYWTYDTTGGWIDRTAAITGAGAAAAISFDFITVWKSRIWFVRNNTSEGYFLDVNAIAGPAYLFNFGPLFQHGGELAAIASWTVDGGAGVDDKLVVVGALGDVLVYAGTDPTDIQTFGMSGRWYVGIVPGGRRFMSDYGGDLAMITERGIDYISKILTARGLLDPESVRDTPSYRYNQIIGTDVAATRGQDFWSILSYSKSQSLIIVTPHNSPGRSGQYVFSELGTAWSSFSDIPMASAAMFEGSFYFGMLDGKVAKAFEADTDDVLSDGTIGTTIQGRVQSAYVTDPANPMSLKIPQFVMPMFQAPAAPAIVAQINTEWSKLGTPGSPTYSGNPGDEWDSGIWNTAIWGSAENAYFSWLGASGLGSYASIRMTVAGLPGTIFTSWKYVYTSGGFM